MDAYSQQRFIEYMEYYYDIQDCQLPYWENFQYMSKVDQFILVADILDILNPWEDPVLRQYITNFFYKPDSDDDGYDTFSDDTFD